MIARSVTNEAAYNETFNIGGDTVYSLNELARETAVAMGVPLRVTHLPPRNEVRDAYASHEKVRKVFGLPDEEMPLPDGLAAMAAWARGQGPREPSVFEAIEVTRNLPPSWLAAMTASRS